jgi:ribonuclease VapC
MTDRFIVDSFALMSLFQDEPGAAQVEALLERGGQGEVDLFMSLVNLGEVIYTMEGRHGVDASKRALAAIDQSPIQLIEVGRSLVLAAARIKTDASLGYADCFVAALAQQLGAAVVTGDPDFKRVEDVVTIEWLPS